MDWTEDFAQSQIKGIGTLEALAALGLTLPAVLDVAPELVPVAAAGRRAADARRRRDALAPRRKQLLPLNLLIAALAMFVAIERFGPHAV
jgi:hypothetical protein